MDAHERLKARRARLRGEQSPQRSPQEMVADEWDLLTAIVAHYRVKHVATEDVWPRWRIEEVASDAAATALDHPELEDKAKDIAEFRVWLHGLVRNAMRASERAEGRKAKHERSLDPGSDDDREEFLNPTSMEVTAMGPTATRDPNLEWDAAIAAANPGLSKADLRKLQEQTVTREEYDALPDVSVVWHRRTYAPVPGLRSDAAEDAYHDAAEEQESQAVADNTVAHLTHSQATVLMLVDEGMTNKQIAEELGISESTVRVHRLKARTRVA